MIMLIFALLIGLPSASVEAALDVAPVWSGHPVGFCLLTAPPHQFVAFYDAERRMTVAQRALEESAWRLTRLDQEIGWDSHNSVTMALDDAGFLHLSGNMHCVPLIYYRSEKPFDAASLVRVPAMVGRDEQMVTYPRFLRGPAGELVFLYRDGRSGSGNEIFNAYDVETRAWRRLLEKPLTDGEGARNAYFEGPVAGPDGYFHLCWVWRESPDCETNHDLSYARSKDLVHWECSDGAPYTLPITLATSEGVDPVPEGGGIINGNARIGFDGAGRVVISYHKHDAQGFTQLYVARREADGWRRVSVSNWTYRWEFSGRGSIPFEIRVSAVAPDTGGALLLPFSHDREGSGRFRLDPDTLQAIERIPSAPSGIPSELRRAESSFPGMSARFAYDAGRAEADGVRYLLRWETLGPNRDRPRDPPWPEPVMLRLYRVSE